MDTSIVCEKKIIVYRNADCSFAIENLQSRQLIFYYIAKDDCSIK